MPVHRGAAPVLVLLASAAPVLAEVADKVEEGQPAARIVTALVLLLLAVAAASHWRRALLLWPVALAWGWASIDGVWDLAGALRREGASGLLWESGLTAAAMVLCPPLFAGIAWKLRAPTGGPDEKAAKR